VSVRQYSDEQIAVLIQTSKAAALREAAEWLEWLNTPHGIPELELLTEQLYTPGNVLTALLLRHRATDMLYVPQPGEAS
jgi:hypothetical protein